MSDDYAALITTIILAVLLIGTVQTYTLLRAWTNSYAETAGHYVEAHNRVVAAVTAGNDPDSEDLELISAVAAPRRLLLLAWPAVTAGSAWLTVCALLVTVQIKVLLWSATHQPETDPQLARWAFYVTSGSVVLLLMEGLVRAALQGLFGVRRSLSGYTPLDAQTRDGFYKAIAQHARNRDRGTQ
ncbi:hypothetical protein [Streptomyces sp. NPDC012466]|uniref:hypothetical protein n=1 Tax=Streptomyces sp. NPDC012466 TaxID=3364835 RepID=UPI0036EE745B